MEVKKRNNNKHIDSEFNYIYWRSKCEDLQDFNKRLLKENVKLRKKLRVLGVVTNP